MVLKVDISMIDVKIHEDLHQGPVLVLRCTQCPDGRVSYPIMRSSLKLASLVRVAEMHAHERHGRPSAPGPVCAVTYLRGGRGKDSRCEKQAGHPGAHGRRKAEAPRREEAPRDAWLDGYRAGGQNAREAMSA